MLSGGSSISILPEVTQLSPGNWPSGLRTPGAFVSEASVYRLLKAHDLITSPAFVVIKASMSSTRPRRRTSLWQNDFTYLKVIGWGWFCCRPSWTTIPLHNCLEALHQMTADDVTATLKWRWKPQAAIAPNVTHKLPQRQRLVLYSIWLDARGPRMDHVRGCTVSPAPGQIERWHQTLKNRILLENYFCPASQKPDQRLRAEASTTNFYHESMDVTPAEAYFGRHTGEND